MIDAHTACVALFGNPVAHSLSPQMHNAAFRHLGLNLVYLAFRVEKAEAAAAAIRTLELRGASITVPHKEAILPHLDEVDQVARDIGAVNTVINQGGRLKGTNTDWLGVVRALGQVMQLSGKRCLVIGAGGAARAAAYGLCREAARVFIMNRTEARGRHLAAAMGCGSVGWQRWEGLEVDMVINATSVGLSSPQHQTLVPRQRLRPGMVVLDMVYRPRWTRLLRDAEAAGCRVVSGVEMLLYQGAAQLEDWTGKPAPLEVMRAALNEALGDEGNQAGQAS